MGSARSSLMASDVFRRIISPTDFSECAEEAWGLAQRLAQPLGSQIVLVHVFAEPTVYGDVSSVAATWTAVAEAEAWVSNELERWADEAKKRGITVRPVMLRGSPATKIV